MRRIIQLLLLLAVFGVVSFYFYGPIITTGIGPNSKVHCPPSHPIMVSVRNATPWRQASVSLQLEGWRNGVSDNILTNSEYSFNKVLAPFEKATLCFPDSSVSTGTTMPNNLNDGSLSLPKGIGALAVAEIQESQLKTAGVEIVVKSAEPAYLR